MGAVYLAHDPQLERLVALKIPRPLDEDPRLWRERFVSEARAAATLHHPNICPVYEVGEAEGQPYLTMAYIEGETLAARLRRTGPLPLGEAVALVTTVSRAMAEAHQRGIVHRDLKPANIMLDRRGQPVVMDFGLALRAVDTDDLRLTLSGVAMGTPCYMPPEQAGGDHDAIGPPADVYSLGVILYELVTGRLPFEGRTFGKLLAQIERDDPPPAQSINPAVDERLGGIIDRALAKAPEDRFASAADLAVALDAWVAGAPLPSGTRVARQLAQTADWKAPRASSAARRPLWKNVALAALGVFLAGLLGVFLYVSTDYGTLVVELNDPTANVDVKVNGQEVVLDGGSVRIRAGANQTLDITGPGYKSISKSFDLKRGDKTVVSVTIEPLVVTPLPTTPGSGEKQQVRAPSPPPKPVAFPAQSTLIEMPVWQLLTDATQQQMQTWLDERKAAKHSVMWLDAASIDDRPVFAGIAALDDRVVDWAAFIDLTGEEINDVAVLAKRFDAQGYVAASVGGYVQDGKLKGVAVLHRGTKEALVGVPVMLNARQNLPRAIQNGFVVRSIRPFTTSGGVTFCGLNLEFALDTPSRHAIDVSMSKLAATLEQQRQAGAYPAGIIPYEVGGERQFAAAFRQDSTNTPWQHEYD